MIPRQPDIHQHPDDYQMSSRKRQHRIHYSRIKSAAIAASYRLMHVSTDNVLVRKTANAAVNGMRPEYVSAALEHKQQVEPDIIDDEMYNHKQNIQPIADLCLVKEPRRNKDDFKPPLGYEFVSLATSDSENRRKPILCGSGDQYYLCYRRRTETYERVITDIQITFKSTIPLGYKPLNYLFDGTQLPYFQINEETEQNSKGTEQNGSNAKDKPSTDSNGTEQNKNKELSEGNNSSEANKSGIANEQKQSTVVSEEKDNVSFDNIPLIIFSKTGDSHIIDIQLKELGTKLREGLISVDRSLDDNVANLNKGTADTTIHPIYISYANDLISYRFSAEDLKKHINLKFLTPLLISLHLRKADLAMTAIDSLKYLLLSNFIRFRDNDLMTRTLQKVCSAVSNSVVTWNTSYHDKLMEIQIIIFQKFIHHLPATCLWSMLVSSLIPLKYDLPKKFLKKYIETSFSYIRILEFGDSLDETGNVLSKDKNKPQQSNSNNIPYQNGHNPTPQSPTNDNAPMAYGQHMNGGHSNKKHKSKKHKNKNKNKPQTLGKIKVDTYDEPEEFKHQYTLFSQMRNFMSDIIDKAVDYSTAERALIKFYQIDLYSMAAMEVVGECCDALFINDSEKPWKPMATMIIFLCRMALCPKATNASDKSDKKREENSTDKLAIRSCRYCTRLLEKIIDTACADEYVERMPNSFKYLLRRTISRTICYNLCNYNFTDSLEDIFNANLRFFEKICLNWYKFFQHEIGVILTQVILPQVLERFTPFRRRQKFLSCISRILLSEKTLIDLVYSLDIINGRRAIHGIVDSLMGILVETAAILKHDKPTFEIADQSAKSYTNNYNFHHLAIQCLTFLCKSYSTWFNTEIIKKNWSSQYLSQCVMDAPLAAIEEQWQSWMKYECINLKARDIASKVDDDKAVKRAIKLLIEEKILSNNEVKIAAWIHRNKQDIPASNVGDYIGGSRPKEEKPLEERIRVEYMKQCNLNYNAHIELVFAYFLTKCGFRLPGEAQKIERVLESFAVCYYEARKEIWENSDAVFVLFNAILMLNTSLHNPRIKEKDKLKKSVFLGMCLNVAGQRLVSSDYERVYHYIEKNEYKISFELEANMAAVKQFQQWKKKCIENARRPLVARTQELEDSINKLNKKNKKLLDRSKSVMNSLNVNSKSGYNNMGSKSYTPSHSNMRSIRVETPNQDFFNELADDYYSATAGGPGDFNMSMDPMNDSLMFFDDEKINKTQTNNNLSHSKSADKDKNTLLEEDNDDDEDRIAIDDEQKKIENEMRQKFEKHKIASIKEDEREYFIFCEEVLQSGDWALRDCANKSMDLIKINDNNHFFSSNSKNGQNKSKGKSVELGCLLIDNWWSRILDALKIVFELTDDPYTTPLVLSILPHFLQITLTLGAFGHEPCKIAFNGILIRYKTWWLQAILRMDEATKNKNPSMAKESDLKMIEQKIWNSPQQYYELLKKYILASQHIVHSRTIWLRLRDLQFEFSDVHFMLKGREFIGEQTILKMGARDTTYRLFFFSDMLLYANGRPGKYRSHRVLLLIFCALEDLKDSRNVTNAFRIHSPQKSITIALPNNEYKRICFKKINELIVKQRKKVRSLIQELLRKHSMNKKKSNQKNGVNFIGDKYLKLAEKFQISSAFLHQSLAYIDANKKPMPQNCKLCLVPFNRLSRRIKECPICNDSVCPKCIQRKARNSQTSKRRNVCDGCLDIVEGRLRL